MNKFIVEKDQFVSFLKSVQINEIPQESEYRLVVRGHVLRCGLSTIEVDSNGPNNFNLSKLQIITFIECLTAIKNQPITLIPDVMGTTVQIWI